MSCNIKCTGYTSLREECIANACLGDNLCHAFDSTISSSVSCLDWCCVNHSGYVFGMTFFFCIGVFLLSTAYYLHRLHQVNVRSGAVVSGAEPTAAAAAGAVDKEMGVKPQSVNY